MKNSDPQKPPISLVELLQQSPLYGLELDIERHTDSLVRDIDFEQEA